MSKTVCVHECACLRPLWFLSKKKKKTFFWIKDAKFFCRGRSLCNVIHCSATALHPPTDGVAGIDFSYITVFQWKTPRLWYSRWCSLTQKNTPKHCVRQKWAPFVPPAFSMYHRYIWVSDVLGWACTVRVIRNVLGFFLFEKIQISHIIMSKLLLIKFENY